MPFRSRLACGTRLRCSRRFAPCSAEGFYDFLSWFPATSRTDLERSGSFQAFLRPSPCCYKLSPRPHVSVADTYGNTGVVYQKQGDYEKALFHYHNTLEIFNKSLGRAMCERGNDQGKYCPPIHPTGTAWQAKILYQDAHEEFLRSLGPTHLIRSKHLEA